VPVFAVDQVGEDQGNEVVVFLGRILHYLEHEEQARAGFLADDVLAVCQLFDEQRNVPSKSSIAQSPVFTAQLLLLHADYHVDDVKSV